MPIITAWSTPGAALIASTSGVPGIRAAVGAFVLAAVLILLTAAIRPLGRLIEQHSRPASPRPCWPASCCAWSWRWSSTCRSAPLLVLPLIALFLVARLLVPTLASLIVLVAGALLAVGLGLVKPMPALGLSRPELIMPAWDVATLIGLGVPLYLVTMASQNLPGFAVLRASGYQPPTQAVLAATGAASLATAFLGAHTSNLAAISAALCTGPRRIPIPAERWKAGVFYALWWGLIALFGASLVGLFGGPAAGVAGHGRRHRPAGLDGRRHGRCPLGRPGSLRRGRHARRHRFGRHADGRRLGVLGAGLRPHRVRHRPLRQALAGAGKRAA